MTNELIFPTDSLFDTLLYDNDTGGWTFLFSDKVYVKALGFWRLLLKGKILYVSLDHGHQFGLTEPLDLVEEVKKTLAGKRLTKIEIDKDTADLTLTMNDDFKLEVYIASSGYETYDFSINNQRYIGLGSGDISIIETN